MTLVLDADGAVTAPPLPGLDFLVEEVAVGRLVPVLGPEVLSAAGPAAVPDSPAALAVRFAQKVALGKRVRGNLWASAQSIETRQHRQTVQALMKEFFQGGGEPNALHRAIAAMRPPLVVSCWYDSALEKAFTDTVSWGMVAGASRHAIGAERWWLTRNALGQTVQDEAADTWTTLVYKPHGCILPDADMLVSDSDYVEVLTEIDIQTPIPPAVKERRTGRGFLYLGCRFDDQLLRTYARQVMKRSGGARYMVLGPDVALTKSETRFIGEQKITVVRATLGTVTAAFTQKQ